MSTTTQPISGWEARITRRGDQLIGQRLVRQLTQQQLVRVRIATVTSLLAIAAAVTTLVVAWEIFDNALRTITFSSLTLFVAVVPILRLLAGHPTTAIAIANNCVPAGLVLSCGFASIYATGQLPFAALFAPAIPLLTMMICSIRASFIWSCLMLLALVIGMIAPVSFVADPYPTWLPLAGSITVLIPTFASMLVHRRIWEDALASEREAHWQLDKRHKAQRLLDLKLSEHDRTESLNLMAGRLAHDLNGFLTSIIGHSDLAKSAMQSRDNDALDHLQAVDLASERARELAAQLLDYTGRGHQTLITVDMKARLSTAVVLAQSTIPKGSRIRLNADQQVFVQGDPTQLDQVVVNLIRNAAESYGDGLGEVELTLTCVEVGVPLTSVSDGSTLAVGQYARITVSDEGCGIPVEVADKLFDPFTTTKPQGRGLGLASVAGIIHSMGGGVTLEHEREQGTAITVWLPGTTQRESDSSASIPVSKISATESSATCVLVADDEPSVREVLAALLSRKKVDVEFACDGLEVLERLKLKQPSVSALIMDVSMPNLDGLAALSQLRDTQPSLPVILVTGYASSATSALQRQDPNLQILQKPFAAEALYNALNRLGVSVQAARS
ncbi:MAG: response regulator [Pseudomonadaceae bacterium]|nr:response regulator [Pseudomonadaceae bacterium]